MTGARAEPPQHGYHRLLKRGTSQSLDAGTANDLLNGVGSFHVAYPSHGKHVEGEGVIPDRIVPHTLEDLRVARDRPLEEAQALLATMKPSAPVAPTQATTR